MWYDIESKELVTREQLFAEYLDALADGIIDDDMTFDGYIKNSLTRYNGTLEEV